MGDPPRWWRDPLAIFFAIGALLFVVFSGFNRDGVTPITLSTEGLAVLVAEYEALTGEAADAADFARLTEDYYVRELLFQEGLKREIQRSDPGIRELIIERMQQAVTGELAEPTGRDLVNFYADHIDRYYAEATITFEQRFFADRPDNPDKILEDLNAGVEIVSDTPWQGKSFPGYGLSMLRGLFGQDLLEQLQRQPLNRWDGPVAARDGWYFFRVTARQPALLLPFERVRDQVLADYQTNALERRVATFVEARRDQYPLVAPR